MSNASQAKPRSYTAKYHCYTGLSNHFAAPEPGLLFAASCSSFGATNMTCDQAASSLPLLAVMRMITSSKLPT